jgi:hypothetical protein
MRRAKRIVETGSPTGSPRPKREIKKGENAPLVGNPKDEEEGER